MQLILQQRSKVTDEEGNVCVCLRYSCPVHAACSSVVATSFPLQTSQLLLVIESSGTIKKQLDEL